MEHLGSSHPALLFDFPGSLLHDDDLSMGGPSSAASSAFDPLLLPSLHPALSGNTDADADGDTHPGSVSSSSPFHDDDDDVELDHALPLHRTFATTNTATTTTTINPHTTTTNTAATTTAAASQQQPHHILRHSDFAAPAPLVGPLVPASMMMNAAAAAAAAASASMCFSSSSFLPLARGRKREAEDADAPPSKKRRAPSAAQAAAANPKSAHALRRQKHNEIELRRRKRMRQHFSELDALCGEVRARAAAAAQQEQGDVSDSTAASPSAASRRRGRRSSVSSLPGFSEKKDKDGILVNAIEQIRAYRAEIAALRELTTSPSATEDDYDEDEAQGSAADDVAPAIAQFRLSASGAVDSVSHGASQLVGSAGEPLGRFVHADDAAALTAALEEIRGGAVQSAIVALRFHTPDGVFHPYNAIVTRAGAGFGVACAEA